MPDLTLLLAGVLAGVFLQRIVGFGMPIIVLPAALIFFEPTSALVAALVVGIISSVIVAYKLKAKTNFDFRIIRALIPSAILGIIFGAFILTIISKDVLQIFLGLSIIFSLSIQKYFFPKPKEKIKIDKKLPIYGMASGFFNSTVALSAGPLIIWARSYVVKPNQVRLLMAYSFIVMNSISILTIQILDNKALTSIPLYVYVLLLPIIVFANYLGTIAANKINENFYDNLAYILLIFAGLAVFVKGILGYF